MRGLSRLSVAQPHRAPRARSWLGRLTVWLVFQLRHLPAPGAHCALCALRFAWEVTARYHCSCPHCERQNARGVWVLRRGGLPEPVTVKAAAVCPSL